MIILCLFINYQPQFVQKSNFSHKTIVLRNVQFLSFRFEKNMFHLFFVAGSVTVGIFFC